MLTRGTGWLIRTATLLSILAPVTVLAQTTTTAALTGTVRDPSGGVVPGVDVTITQSDTGASRSTTTDGNGVYTAGFLPPGRYNLKFALAGFKTILREGVTLNVTETVAVDARMEV